MALAIIMLITAQSIETPNKPRPLIPSEVKELLIQMHQQTESELTTVLEILIPTIDSGIAQIFQVQSGGIQGKKFYLIKDGQLQFIHDSYLGDGLISIITNDFDKNGINEIVLLFDWGGSGVSSRPYTPYIINLTDSTINQVPSKLLNLPYKNCFFAGGNGRVLLIAKNTVIGEMLSRDGLYIFMFNESLSNRTIRSISGEH